MVCCKYMYMYMIQHNVNFAPGPVDFGGGGQYKQMVTHNCPNAVCYIDLQAKGRYTALELMSTPEHLNVH